MINKELQLLFEFNVKKILIQNPSKEEFGHFLRLLIDFAEVHFTLKDHIDKCKEQMNYGYNLSPEQLLEEYESALKNTKGKFNKNGNSEESI